MTQPIIEVENLSKRYQLGQFGANTLRDELENVLGRILRKSDLRAAGRVATEGDFWALRDVSFRVESGEVLGIVGRNGAGKSTLLKILSRVTEPTSGQARIRGRVASLLEVGTGFHPELTGRENIYLNGAVLGMTHAEVSAKFDEIVDFSEVGQFLNTPVKRYSSGMYVRLAFAVAAHLDPEILIVDEVLAVGDAAFQKKCLGRMKDVSGREGRTVLFVSHNMAAVEALCTKAILIEGGRISQEGSAPEITTEYLAANAQLSGQALHIGATQFIKSIRVLDRFENDATSFQIGDTAIFDIELESDTHIEHPRLGIGIHTPRGERIATLHTDIQQAEHWGFSGRRRLRATWDDLPLNVGEYRFDVGLWGYNSELETLLGCGVINILPKDVYGTGRLPDPSFQGYVLPQVRWEMNRP